ncbi:MAG: thioredoxin family protein [Rhizobiales bacterium]|nr:thioredoxin family protein [Hyphomicrobiales bacterium]
MTIPSPADCGRQPPRRTTLKRIASASLVLFGLGCAAAFAEPGTDPVGVVELFTSQGCSSCPPADSVFSELAEKENVVALAYHVDYWDYLGWRDTLGNPDNTARQYDYMKAFKARAVYTPQAVINGRKHVNGASRQEIDKAIGDLSRQNGGLSVDVKATRQGSNLMIVADAASGGPREAEVVLVYFEPPTPIQIEHGENTGKTVTYWNAVSGLQVAGMWHGRPASFELPMREVEKKGAGGCAVLLQSVNADGSPGAILGATVLHEPRI